MSYRLIFPVSNLPVGFALEEGYMQSLFAGSHSTRSPSEQALKQQGAAWGGVGRRGAGRPAEAEGQRGRGHGISAGILSMASSLVI